MDMGIMGGVLVMAPFKEYYFTQPTSYYFYLHSIV